MKCRLAEAHIEPVRAASRKLVRELGFMQGSLAGTALSPSAVHALIEIGARGARTASDVSKLLLLEKSSVSRLLRKLIDIGDVMETRDATDGRTKHLSLTRKGEAVVAGIHAFARRQVMEALDRLASEQQETVVEGLRLYADALAARLPAGDAAPSIGIECGYRPGIIGRCVEMHARYYTRAAGFGRVFEATVASGLSEFSARLGKACNRLWCAVQDGRIVGTLAIDGEDLAPEIAHLRWFVVEDGLRGSGIGRRLLTEAMAFCDRYGFAETQLWTFRGLDVARRLYEAQGFALAEEWRGRQWGEEVMEQRFVRQRKAND